METRGDIKHGARGGWMILLKSNNPFGVIGSWGLRSEGRGDNDRTPLRHSLSSTSVKLQETSQGGMRPGKSPVYQELDKWEDPLNFFCYFFLFINRSSPAILWTASSSPTLRVPCKCQRWVARSVHSKNMTKPPPSLHLFNYAQEVVPLSIGSSKWKLQGRQA